MTGSDTGGHETIHASACVVGEAGVLVRGPSGSGKSALVHHLIEAGRDRGLFVRLVADDRVALTARNGRVLARPVFPLAGLLELRGIGIARLPFEAAAVVRLVVDLETGQRDRLPGPADLSTELLGTCVPCMALHGPENFSSVLWRVCDDGDRLMTVP